MAPAPITRLRYCAAFLFPLTRHPGSPFPGQGKLSEQAQTSAGQAAESATAAVNAAGAADASATQAASSAASAESSAGTATTK
ncbi:hypothetical protein ZM41_22305, partial [Salmonella enterica subsp. enterica serovar Newport]|nr:hypothetical protein [Salmonella enterica subsp. enterica serovar Newport]ECM5868576.1 hypothetical protein [Salmonella enterica subsp. enterica serovar Newport]ECN9111099.1 hypothetical protein [Salmonella enterica subsp. enterica serovar Newport]ECN9451406.1 hypothetical protein [Salmonella enterica subsp. enterica serovar Newport]EDA9240743.1 hypothetical protein [Salmonella enterica subsp. enterica serovar Newport]